MMVGILMGMGLKMTSPLCVDEIKPRAAPLQREDRGIQHQLGLTRSAAAEEP